jgi:hypothetical protein
MGKMKIIIALLWTISGMVCFAQTSLESSKKQHPDSIRNELIELFEELSLKHPGYYRYNEQQKFDDYVDSVVNTIQEPLTEIEILRKVKPVIAKIGCLHTGIRLSDETTALLNERPNCLPFVLYQENGKVYIWKTFGETSIPPGSEIVSINGRNIQDIYKVLLANIPMDGFNTTGKLKLLQYSFPNWYRTIIEIAEEFEIELIGGEKYNVKGVNYVETLHYDDIVKSPLSLVIEGDLAIIKIPSFSNSYISSKNQHFKKEIKSYLKQIDQNRIGRILIDVKGNTGGTDSNPAWLTSHFFDGAYRYWDRIEVTEAIAIDVTGMSHLFYGKPTYKEGKWLWSDKGLSSKEFAFTQPQQPSKNYFDGQIFILADGMCLSSCSDFVAIMQSNLGAIIIGEETGGGYEGNTSGLIPSEQLACGLIIDVPLLAYFNHVSGTTNKGRGTIPNINMRPTLEELTNDKGYLERVIDTIASAEYSY